MTFPLAAEPADADRELCRKHSVETARIIADSREDGTPLDKVSERLFPLGATTLYERTSEHMLWVAGTDAKLSLRELSANGYSFCVSNSY